MSTDTNIIMWTTSPQEKLDEIYKLISSSEYDSFKIVTLHYGESWHTKEWSFSEDRTLFGPGGWALQANTNIIKIYHMTRFGSIDSKTEEGTAILNSLNWFGKIIESDQAIFTHELLPIEDITFSESVGALRKKWKEANSWEEMCQADFFENNCWILMSLPLVINKY